MIVWATETQKHKKSQNYLPVDPLFVHFRAFVIPWHIILFQMNSIV